MNILERIPGENARSYAVRVLRSNIISLQLPPGSIVSENEISSALNLSRTPIREALIELSRSKLVEILPQKGSYVTRIDLDLAEESRFLRCVVETAVFRQAAEQQLPERFFLEMKDNIAQHKLAYAAGDRERALNLDNEFHKMAYAAAGKLWTFGVVREQMVHFDRLRSLNIRVDEQDHTIKDHEELQYALEKHDPELCEYLLNRHLSRHRLVRETLLERYPDYFVK
jgi:DNA-binding GntR family transcriptional regulator